MTSGLEENITNVLKTPAQPVQRLCNEIQLFDLCDLEVCTFKEGKFCTNAEHLAAFEQIADAEVRSEVFASDELEDDGDAGDEVYDEAFDDDEFDDERGYEED
jgi:hypothetical protein